MHLSMDHHLQQWWCQQQQQPDQPSAKVAKLAAAQKPSEQESQLSSAALSLFVSEPNLKHFNNINMSAFPIPETFCGSFKMGAFSFSQWQELKQQALIYKYMIAGVTVPLDLILPIKNSLLNSYHHQHNPHFHHHYHHRPTILQSGYWGRPLVDAEPGRCRRTDGKKWRCSRDVVTGQKYCERHVHRGKNRSRKPVETSPTIPSSTSNDSSIKNISPPSSKVINPLCSSSLTTESCFTFSGSSPSTDLFQLNCRSPEGKLGNGSHVQCNLEKFPGEDSAGTGKILRHFFDEWPTSPSNSNTHLSISISANPTSDFSLKLSTGDVTNSSNGGGGNRRQPVPAANWAVWESHNPEGSIGGPLAEALRSSGSTSSPKSVLHKPNSSVSETSSVST